MGEEGSWENLYEVKMNEISQLKDEIEELKAAYRQMQVTSEPSPKNSEKQIELPEDVYSNFYLEKLRDIFFRYATVFSTNENFIALSHFRLIFKELGLSSKDLNWQKAELMYHSISKRSNIDFPKFIKLMKKIAYQKFKSNDYLTKLAPLLKIPEKRMDLIDKNIEQWIEESESVRIKEIMSSYDELLRIIYSVYNSKEIKHQNRMSLANLLEFCSDCKIVPAIVSSLEVARIFRAIEFKESLGYEDFLTVFACVGFLGMSKIGIGEPIQALDKILVILSGNSEFIYTKKSQSNRWNSEN